MAELGLVRGARQIFEGRAADFWFVRREVKKWRKGFERLEKKGAEAPKAIFCLILGGFLTSCLQIVRKDGILCASSGGIGLPQVNKRTKVKWQRRKLFRQPRAES